MDSRSYKLGHSLKPARLTEWFRACAEDLKPVINLPVELGPMQVRNLVFRALSISNEDGSTLWFFQLERPDDETYPDELMATCEFMLTYDVGTRTGSLQPL